MLVARIPAHAFVVRITSYHDTSSSPRLLVSSPCLSQTFEEVFRCIPSDKVSTWDDLAAWRRGEWGGEDGDRGPSFAEQGGVGRQTDVCRVAQPGDIKKLNGRVRF